MLDIITNLRNRRGGSRSSPLNGAAKTECEPPISAHARPPAIRSTLPKRPRLRRRLALCGVTLALLFTGSVAAYASGADVGTIGDGYTTYPNASPYISYAHVTRCIPQLGVPGAAFVVRGKATLGTDIAYGAKATAGDPESLVTIRKVGSYHGSWYCKKLS